MATPDSPSSHLTLQMLAWLDDAPRTYGETMNAWRTSCPRLSIWEDAVGDGLVRITRHDGAKTPGGMRDARVGVTPKGKRLLARSRHGVEEALRHRAGGADHGDIRREGKARQDLVGRLGGEIDLPTAHAE